MKSRARRVAAEILNGQQPHDSNGNQQRPYGDAYEGPLPDDGCEQHAQEPPPKGAGQRKEQKRASVGFQWEPIDSTVFADKDCRPSWLMKHALVTGQPAIVGGPRKSLKTSIISDLAVSLAAGVPFLGEFAVEQPVRVAVLSGESGEWTLQETARRICTAKGFSFRDIGDMLLWQFSLPMLARPGDLAALADGLSQKQAGVVILDPLYLSLLGGQGPNGARAENLYDMGPLFLSISRACLDAGATPILIHHTRRAAGKSTDPLDLDDLAYSGVAEFARQWLLLSRREPYQPGTGQHRLWLHVGGSAGHGGLWSVDVDEGVIDTDFSGRIWDVTVATATEARQTEADTKRQEKVTKQRQQDDADDKAVLAALDAIDPDRKGAVYNRVRLASLLPRERTERATARLVAAGIVAECEVKAEIGMGAQRPSRGLRRVANDEDA